MLGFLKRTEAQHFVAMLEALCEEEGTGVEFGCGNPEADSLDEQHAVDVYGSWCNDTWTPRRFYGATRFKALEAAYLAMPK
jgi:hypothetical protein